MPPPRKQSPRHKERRARSRSYSPKHSRRRRSRSPSRSPKRRSRSPQRKHSKNRKQSPHSTRKSKSPHTARRSRSPHTTRRSRSPHTTRRSRSPKRRPQSPHPVKRPADSSGKRSYRSRSRSPTPQKKNRDARYFKESSPVYTESRRRRSPSPVLQRQSLSPVQRRRSPSPYRGKAHMDRPSSSKQPLFPVERKKNVIDSVKIIDLVPKEKLDKRFQTLEQLAQGPFYFEENITIGIHRGPQHIELDNDDVPVNYDFKPRTFIMLFPKRDFSNPIFDRDEIKAFRYDDILDEEALVEKRTITVKPAQKQKPKWMDDYKITVGQDREGYGDKRMVKDSKSRRHRSRSPDYQQEVKIRLDPKPDPRYERLYREQQRHEDHSLHEDIHRNPNDLRYSLNKRKTDYDRDRSPGRDRDRDGDRGRDGGRFDARSKIEERRRGSWSDDRGDRRGDRRDPRNSPGRNYGEKRKIDLPDFKNRPVSALSMPDIWFIGTSLVQDIESYKHEDKDLIEMLKDNVASITYHSDADLKLNGILPAVKKMLETHSAPKMVVIQCGENDINENKKEYKAVKQDLKTIGELIPNVRLVWIGMLPPWAVNDKTKDYETMVDLYEDINSYMMKSINSEDINGCIILHNLASTRLKDVYFEEKDGKQHISVEGLNNYVARIKESLEYFISGAGSIFPYIKKWPPSRMNKISPECICLLDKQQLENLSESQLLEMSIEQIQKLSTEQINTFNKEQESWLYCRRLVQNLTQFQVKGFRVYNMENLTLDQINLFLETQSEYLKTDVQKAAKKRRDFLAKRSVPKPDRKGPRPDRGRGKNRYGGEFKDEVKGRFSMREKHRTDRRARGFRGRGRGYVRGRGFAFHGERERRSRYREESNSNRPTLIEDGQRLESSKRFDKIRAQPKYKYEKRRSPETKKIDKNKEDESGNDSSVLSDWEDERPRSRERSYEPWGLDRVESKGKTDEMLISSRSNSSWDGESDSDSSGSWSPRGRRKRSSSSDSSWSDGRRRWRRSPSFGSPSRNSQRRSRHSSRDRPHFRPGPGHEFGQGIPHPIPNNVLQAPPYFPPSPFPSHNAPPSFPPVMNGPPPAGPFNGPPLPHLLNRPPYLGPIPPPLDLMNRPPLPEFMNRPPPPEFMNRPPPPEFMSRPPPPTFTNRPPHPGPSLPLHDHMNRPPPSAFSNRQPHPGPMSQPGQGNPSFPFSNQPQDLPGCRPGPLQPTLKAGPEDLHTDNTEVETRQLQVNQSNLVSLTNDPFDNATNRQRQRWGHCQLCDISLYSEEEAHDHVSTIQHQSNETAAQGNVGNTRQSSQLHRDRNQRDRYAVARSDDRRGGAGKDPRFIDKFQYDAWKNNPEEIPKGPGYYEHDNRNRDDMNFWERKQMFLETGRYPARGGLRGRGSRGNFRGRVTGGYSRGFRGRGNFRGTTQNPYIIDRRRKSDSANDEWKHDKFSELDESGSSKEDGQEWKQEHRHGKGDTKDKDTSERNVRRNRKGEKDADEIFNQEENMKIDVNVEVN